MSTTISKYTVAFSRRGVKCSVFWSPLYTANFWAPDNAFSSKSKGWHACRWHLFKCRRQPEPIFNSLSVMKVHRVSCHSCCVPGGCVWCRDCWPGRPRTAPGVLHSYWSGRPERKHRCPVPGSRLLASVILYSNSDPAGIDLKSRQKHSCALFLKEPPCSVDALFSSELLLVT